MATSPRRSRTAQAIVDDSGATTRVAADSRSRCCVVPAAWTRPASARAGTGGWPIRATACLRFERTLLGEADDPLWQHLGADSQSRPRSRRLLPGAVGIIDAALTLLARPYPAVAAPMHEAGVVAPADSPLVAIYRGFVRARLGGDGGPTIGSRRRCPPTTSFPARRSSYAVLNAALAPTRSRPRAGSCSDRCTCRAGSPRRPSTRGSACGDRSRRSRRCTAISGSRCCAIRRALAARRAVLEEGVGVDRDQRETCISRSTRCSARWTCRRGIASPRSAISAADGDAVGAGVQAGAGARGAGEAMRPNAVPRPLLPA